jgi:hypothetical protein
LNQLAFSSWRLKRIIPRWRECHGPGKQARTLRWLDCELQRCLGSINRRQFKSAGLQMRLGWFDGRDQGTRRLLNYMTFHPHAVPG